MGQAKNIQGALRNIRARLSVLRFLTTASTISSASMAHRYQMRTRKAGIRAWPSTVFARSSSRSWLLLSRSEVFWTSSSVSQPLIRSLFLFSVMSTQKRGVISILLSLFQSVGADVLGGPHDRTGKGSFLWCHCEERSDAAIRSLCVRQVRGYGFPRRPCGPPRNDMAREFPVNGGAHGPRPTERLSKEHL